MIAIGIDPDLHSTAVALVSRLTPGKPLKFWSSMVLKVPKSLKGEAAVEAMTRKICKTFFDMRGVVDLGQVGVVVVEGQSITFNRTKNPDSILKVAQVAGAAAGAFWKWPSIPVLLPRPQDWTNVPKHVMQRRAAERLGWAGSLRGGKDPYFSPENKKLLPEGATGMDWKHLMDAIALAMWGLKVRLTGVRGPGLGAR